MDPANLGAVVVDQSKQLGGRDLLRRRQHQFLGQFALECAGKELFWIAGCWPSLTVDTSPFETGCL